MLLSYGITRDTVFNSTIFSYVTLPPKSARLQDVKPQSTKPTRVWSEVKFQFSVAFMEIILDIP